MDQRFHYVLYLIWRVARAENTPPTWPSSTPQWRFVKQPWPFQRDWAMFRTPFPKRFSRSLCRYDKNNAPICLVEGSMFTRLDSLRPKMAKLTCIRPFFRSQAKTESPHVVNITIDTSHSTVSDAFCTCKAGLVISFMYRSNWKLCLFRCTKQLIYSDVRLDLCL